MKLLNKAEFKNYIKDNFKFLGSFPENEFITEIDSRCDSCNKEAFLKVEANAYASQYRTQNITETFRIFFVQCPNCKRKSFLQTVFLMKKLKMVKLMEKRSGMTTIINYMIFLLKMKPTQIRIFQIQKRTRH